MSSARGHNQDVSGRRAELTREGHNFNCAAGVVGLLISVGDPTRSVARPLISLNTTDGDLLYCYPVIAELRHKEAVTLT